MTYTSISAGYITPANPKCSVGVLRACVRIAQRKHMDAQEEAHHFEVSIQHIIMLIEFISKHYC